MTEPEIIAQELTDILYGLTPSNRAYLLQKAREIDEIQVNTINDEVEAKRKRAEN